MNCDNTANKKLSPYFWMMEETSCRNIEDYLYDSYDVDMDIYGGYQDVCFYEGYYDGIDQL